MGMKWGNWRGKILCTVLFVNYPSNQFVFYLNSVFVANSVASYLVRLTTLNPMLIP